MSWQGWIIVALLFFIGGLISGFYLASKWIEPGDDIELKNVKAKRGGILNLTNILKRKKKKS